MLQNEYTLGMSDDPRVNMQNQGARGALGDRMAQADYGNAQTAQRGALGMYQDAAAGNGPSAAQSMLQHAGDQNRANAMAMAGMSRGGNIAGQAQAAQVAAMAANAQTQQQAAQLRAQEQQAAMQGYGQLGMGMGDQALQQQAMSQQMMQGAMGMQLQDDIARREAAQRAREWRTQRNMGWADFGMNAAGTALEAFGLGGGGIG